jgi:hypothetical protein
MSQHNKTVVRIVRLAGHAEFGVLTLVIIVFRVIKWCGPLGFIYVLEERLVSIVRVEE